MRATGDLIGPVSPGEMGPEAVSGEPGSTVRSGTVRMPVDSTRISDGSIGRDVGSGLRRPVSVTLRPHLSARRRLDDVGANNRRARWCWT
jgi:hypothetical protein